MFREVQPPAAVPIRVGDIGIDLEIEYRSSSGKISQRLITLHELSWLEVAGGAPTDVRLRAYCHATKMPKTFLGISVRSAHVATTGETIDDLVEWIEGVYRSYTHHAPPGPAGAASE